MAGYLAVRACFNADCTQARSAASGPRDAVANRIKRRNGRLSAKHSTAAHPVAHSRHPEISPIPLTYAVILSISISINFRTDILLFYQWDIVVSGSDAITSAVAV
ncbi:hypothetical protein [Burkholderia pseudomallei]|uniref:hypothetical protein n=1 Tax=Burkholderia pseudomallei TaxID=28450 RepID=UPI001293292E|nr:hypothetical protein [Burkholderia pseudomallei]MBM5580566.1 hypothetical protein [Burkholderia pseudomallei]MBM5587100.1 hypothetical protein [Burkholderia pseudomallei]MBM5621404.1 hypothetical protein [Burkholderia pseudomallei]MBM5633887.1 hypothetical protein [Burkholderia pseudomallei]